MMKNEKHVILYKRVAFLKNGRPFFGSIGSFASEEDARLKAYELGLKIEGWDFDIA